MAEVRVLEAEGAPLSAAARARNVLEALKVQESLFALPFAYTAMLIGAGGFPTWSQFLWITLAMVGARNFGMAMNRVIDKEIDGANPRNRERHLPSGRTKTWEMLLFSLGALALFLASAWMLNSLAFILAWPAAAYLLLYSYAKRFTWVANLFLGWALAIGPAGAWVGVTGSTSWKMGLMAGAVFLWASAFDILYHLPSRDFYIERGLHSVPRRFGVRAALIWSRASDFLAVLAFLGIGVWTSMGWPYYVGIALAGVVMAYKHSLLMPYEPSKIGRAFFRYNAMISGSIFAFTLVAVLA